MMEVCEGLPGPDLDVILHTPGGRAEATASIVAYLRQKFTNIRVLFPWRRCRPASMWALAADTIVMGAHSSSARSIPSSLRKAVTSRRRAIVEPFDRAKQVVQRLSKS